MVEFFQNFFLRNFIKDLSIEEQGSNKDLLNVSTNHSLYFLSPPKLTSLPQVQSQPFIKIDQQERANSKESLAKSMLKSQVRAKSETETNIISQSKLTEDLSKATGKSKKIEIKNPSVKI